MLLYFIYNLIIIKILPFLLVVYIFYKINYIINKRENLNDNIILKEIKVKVLT
jgi:hypothetical protein